MIALDDDTRGKFYCVYYDEGRFWGRLLKVFADDPDADANMLR